MKQTNEKLRTFGIVRKMVQEYLYISLKHFQYATGLTYQSARNIIKVPEMLLWHLHLKCEMNLNFEDVSYVLNIFGGDSNQAAAPRADIGNESSSSSWLF